MSVTIVVTFCRTTFRQATKNPLNSRLRSRLPHSTSYGYKHSWWAIEYRRPSGPKEIYLRAGHAKIYHLSDVLLLWRLSGAKHHVMTMWKRDQTRKCHEPLLQNLYCNIEKSKAWVSHFSFQTISAQDRLCYLDKVVLWQRRPRTGRTCRTAGRPGKLRTPPGSRTLQSKSWS